jgi:hypothetical protein
MRHRRRAGAPPSPPPLGGIAIDGANVIAATRSRAIERLQAAVQWFRSWRPDLAIHVFIDHTTYRACSAAVQQELDRLAATSSDRVHCAVCAPGEPADVPLLRHAAATRSLVVSNDRFFAHADLRANALTVQFAFADGAFTPVDPATWFRTPGQARWVPLADLQRAR